jgi:hypothetical protein
LEDVLLFVNSKRESFDGWVAGTVLFTFSPQNVLLVCGGDLDSKRASSSSRLGFGSLQFDSNQRFADEFLTVLYYGWRTNSLRKHHLASDFHCIPRSFNILSALGTEAGFYDRFDFDCCWFIWAFV